MGSTGQQITVVMALSSLSSDERSKASVAAACIAEAPGVTATSAAAVAAPEQHEEVVVHRRDGGHPTESLVEQMSSGYGSGYVCLMGRKQLSRGIQKGKSPEKTNVGP